MLQMQKITYPADNYTAIRARVNANGLYARVISLLICALSIVSCEEPYTSIVNLGIDESYAIERMRTLILHPEFPGEKYEWYLTSSPSASHFSTDSIIATTRDLIFCQADTGAYEIQLKIYDKLNPVTYRFKVVVWEEQVAYSPYISRVLEYNPAPGQFVNTMPMYEEGDTYEIMRQKAEESISSTNKTSISLGAWGGYVTFAFDHSVVNIPDELDFFIEGNAFLSSAMQKGGSSEPGIVMVSIDVNQNGLPDDPFYQLAGSEYHNPATIHQYALTYHRTPADHVPEFEKKSPITDSVYIRWTDNQGEVGYVKKNSFHSQNYFPMWLKDSTLTFYGSCLPDNAQDASSNGTYWVQNFYGQGYADCNPNDSVHLNSFDISWAVTQDGTPISLPCADFVRVYTGVNQECGWIGETSTEISHARDLHVLL